MSAATARPRYDLIELRRRMSVGVSAPVLRDVGALMGLPLAEASVDGLSRELLRRAEQAGVVDVLLGHLHERAPLVEWPEPLAGEEEAVPSAEGAAAEVVAEPQEAQALVEETAAPDGSLPAEEVAEVEGASDAGAPSTSAGPASAWIPPGHADPRQKGAASAKGGVDPRVFVLVAALMLGAAVVAFAAGRVSAGAQTDTRPARPAAHAAAAFQAGLGAVARTCKVSAEPPLGTAVLQAAYDVCGVKPQRERRPAGTQVDPGDEPGATDAAPTPGPLVPKPTQSELPAPTTSCVKRCSTEHNGCRTGCGPEPRESGGYALYQGCLAKCLTASSSCRLACETE